MKDDLEKEIYLNRLKELGESLEEIRIKKKNLSINEISNILKINEYYLLSIEKGNISELYKKTYVIGFIKEYCNFLGAKSEYNIYLSLFTSKHLNYIYFRKNKYKHSSFSSLVSEKILDNYFLVKKIFFTRKSIGFLFLAFMLICLLYFLNLKISNNRNNSLIDHFMVKEDLKYRTDLEEVRKCNIDKMNRYDEDVLFSNV